MKYNKLLHLLPFCGSGAHLCRGYVGTKTGLDQSSSLKAEYIFLEAANARANENIDDYYMLLRHANRLAPDDPYIRASLAEVELAVPGTDSIGLERAYDAIAERFRLEPTNQRYAAVFSNLAQQAPPYRRYCGYLAHAG